MANINLDDLANLVDLIQPLAKRPFQWVIDKFNPPGWENDIKHPRADEMQSFFYDYLHKGKREPKWRDVQVVKMPTDLILYQQAIWEKKPDFIIECGTRFGGSALFLADMLEMTGKGQVISIDINKRNYPEHKRITYLTGPTTDAGILEEVRKLVGNGTVMAVLDSDHSRRHVKRELHFYSRIVTSGQYIVVEDCYDNQSKVQGPGEARDWFLQTHKGFVQTNLDEQFLIGYTKGGWICKKQ